MRTEDACEFDFRQRGPFWHLYTPGDLTGILFADRDDFIFGMNLMAVCAAMFPELRIITFTLMSNHIHVLLCGDREAIEGFFNVFRKRLKRYLADRIRYPDLRGFQPGLTQLPDLRAMRSEIVYINRNGYVVQPDHTPYSYPWGAGILYFNPLLKSLPKTPLNDLPQSDRKQISRSRLMDLPGHYAVCRGVIAPSTFCAIEEGESYFRNAHQYFRLLSRNAESESEIAKRLGDQVFLTDEELYGVARTLSNQHYGSRSLATLPPTAKQELARRLHFDYKASPKQLQRLLRMDPKVLEAMFPRIR